MGVGVGVNRRGRGLEMESTVKYRAFLAFWGSMPPRMSVILTLRHMVRGPVRGWFRILMFTAQHSCLINVDAGCSQFHLTLWTWSIDSCF
jgi:hypothetical protein